MNKIERTEVYEIIKIGIKQGNKDPIYWSKITLSNLEVPRYNFGLYSTRCETTEEKIFDRVYFEQRNLEERFAALSVIREKFSEFSQINVDDIAILSYDGEMTYK